MFEWDETKRAANRDKHGVDFETIFRFDWASAIIQPDRRHGEPRWEALGFIGARLHVAIFTVRGARRRLISLRKANDREQRRHARSQPLA